MMKSNIIKISRERLKDADILFKSRRYEGAIYICGYALELRLKHQICKRLNWTIFPPNGSNDYKNFKTHVLDVLLGLTGKEKLIRNSYFAEWSIASKWNPQSRYQISSATTSDALLMISSTKTLLNKLRILFLKNYVVQKNLFLLKRGSLVFLQLFLGRVLVISGIYFFQPLG